MNTNAKIALLAGILLPGMALAQLDLGDTMGTQEAEIRATLEAEGYTVTEIEFDDDEIEAEVIQNNTAYEIVLSPETGEIIEMALEDGDDGHDGDDCDKND